MSIARVIIVMLVVLSFLGTVALPVVGVGPLVNGVGDRGPGPLVDGSPWTDSLDDLSNVYVPSSGLVGVELVGGQVQLETGSSEGWIASSIVSQRPGYRYDYVLLDAEAPGDSVVQISILNASEEASEVGYANETIVGFRKVEGTDLSVYPIPPNVYPDLRIQVNLVAAGADRPILKEWTMFFVPLHQWQDEFLGSGKMSDHRSINFTGGNLEINMSGKKASSGPVDYEPYPPIVVAGYNSQLQVLYPNQGGNGYENPTLLENEYYNGLAIDDYDADGNLDIAVANSGIKSKILWGTSSGEFTTAGVTKLTVEHAVDVGEGDFNGDGYIDLAFAVSDSGSIADSVVFLNDGGAFDTDPDIVFTDEEYADVATGDLNNDGFDDLCYYSWTGVRIYYGGPDGPDKIPDLTFDPATCRDVLIQDLDLDGYLDILITENPGDKPDLYLGGIDGPDTTIDHSFTVSSVLIYGAEAGDINGDGYIDIVFNHYGNSEYRMEYFPGSASGWSDGTQVNGPIFEYGRIAIGDVDKDGYDDIVAAYSDGGSGYYTSVYKGGTNWPMTPGIHKTGGANRAVALAIPKASRLQAFRGSFTTVDITKPHDMGWDMVAVEGTVPKNTSITISVLDDRGKIIPGYFDVVAGDLDMSGIDLHDTIKVRVTMSSELNDTTPLLDRIVVKWMEPMIWRDEFYGPAKVERTLGLEVGNGVLGAVTKGNAGPPLLFPTQRSDEGFVTKSHVYNDAGDLDYLSEAPMTFGTRGASAVDLADANGDGFIDVAFALRQSGESSFGTESPLYLGSNVGFRKDPDAKFPTVGASAVAVRDLNGDGYTDVVFSQELKAVDDHSINSTLFWGSASGWNTTPDVEFVTKGASDVEVVDLDRDGLLDLVFACYKDTSTTTDSMVFIQGTGGFDGSSPDHLLPTRGARAVASGMIDGDGLVDLVFANSFSGGFAEIDSFVYLGKAGGGFHATPTPLPTIGAMDVEVGDIDGDGHLDIVFANQMDNSLDHYVDSYVYLNDGSGGFGAAPAATLPTGGALAVAIADLDGTGWKDLVFACMDDGTTYEVPSVAYLGGISGYPSSADIVIPTTGASDVAVGELMAKGLAGYLSRPIVVEDERNTGSFHTLRYDAILGPSQTATLRLVDADTWEVLAEASAEHGAHEWIVEGLFRFKEHPKVRVMISVEGLDGPGTFAVDDLWLNWTQRIERAPVVGDMGVSASSVYRTKAVDLWLNVSDEYDPVTDLVVTIQHRLNGTSDPWETFLLGSLEHGEASVSTTILPRVGAPAGTYDFRALSIDTDQRESAIVLFPRLLEVLNNLPTTPEVRIVEPDPITTSTPRVELVTSATDTESPGLQYHYTWFRDGVLEPNATGESLSSFLTAKGQNWTVEVRAFDGEDEGAPAIAWCVIENAPPARKNALPDPDLDEDTIEDQWINLMNAFDDADDDPLTWSVAVQPDHIQVTIDHATGQVTFEPAPDWHGETEVTFVASDGELSAQQTVTVIVHPVNDIPKFATVNGEPVTGATFEFTIGQGEELVIRYTVADVEGDEVVGDVTSTVVAHDEVARTITFTPEPDEVGTLSFTLRINDVVSAGERVSLDFIITVEDVNDPMDDPRITNPAPGETYNVNQTFTLIAVCSDPDVPFGQVLNYTWESNISGLLGHGASLTLELEDPGRHSITLTVRDPDFAKTSTVEVVIKPSGGVIPPPPDDEEEVQGFDWVPWAAVLAVLVLVGAAFYIVATKRRTEDLEDADEEEYRREHMTRALKAVKAAADHLEAGQEEAKDPEANGWAETSGIEEVEVVAPDTQLSMEASVTEAVSGDIAKLWEDVPEVDERTEEDRAAMRLDNMKRQYQNAIGRLPYGIPSSELADRDWVDLANALATGDKRTVDGGREVTEIDGRWYHSDHEDTGTFLKEHGAKPRAKERKAAAPATDKQDLLDKLEERFILGEITEETYKNLKEKYDG